MQTTPRRRRLTTVLAWIGASVGVLFLACSGGFLFMMRNGGELDRTSKEYARETVQAIAPRWDADELTVRMHPQLRPQVSAEELLRLFAWFETLGPLEELGEPVGESEVFFDIVTGMHPNRAHYRIPATFEKASGTFTIELVEQDGHWTLSSFHLNSPGLVPPVNAKSL